MTGDGTPIGLTEAERAVLGRAFGEASSVFRVLSTVRTRRMGLGYRSETGEPEVFEWSGGRTALQPAGPLAYASGAPPLPLSEGEQALLAWAALGPNGMALADVAVEGGLTMLQSRLGRTAPSFSNDLGVKLMVIDDSGARLYDPAPEPPAPVEIAGPEDHWKVLDWFRRAKRITNRRPDVDWTSAPPGTHAVRAMGAGQYNLNRPGSTWFLPVGDVGLEWFGLLLSSYEWGGFYLQDPDTQKPAGCDEWIRPGALEVGFPLPLFDETALLLYAHQAGCVVQNVRLACEALGLGAWTLGSYADDLVLGAYPDVAIGIPFRYLQRHPHTNPTGTVTCLGLEGVLEPVVVPSQRFPTAADAVRYVKERRFAAGGLLAPPDGDGGPLRSEAARDILEHPRAHLSDWAEEAAIATVTYIVRKHGCCPAYVNPVRAKFSVQVHHVDSAYYRRFHTGGDGDAFPLTPQILEHFATWHPGEADPTRSDGP